MRYIFLIIIFLVTTSVQGITFNSSDKQATLIELFTSQGCHSCPPAEKWLGKFVNNDELWNTYVPIAWHVNYWDYLGWQDKYAQQDFTDRQVEYRNNKNLNAVYTPGLLKNGKEWRSWFLTRHISPSKKIPGVLSVNYDQGIANINFADLENNPQQLEFNIALLGINLEANIATGENRGKRLMHNFVVLEHKALIVSDHKTSIPFQIDIKPNYAMAVWISNPKTKEVIQATGTWLTNQ